MRIFRPFLGALAFWVMCVGAGGAQTSGDACQAIYTEARDTKSCIAYEAYVGACGSHALLPVAKLFLERECGGEPATASSKPAGRKAAPLHDCDRMAGHPDDPDGVGGGVSFADIKVSAATYACHHAIGRYSREPRFRYQLGRIYDKAKDYDNAHHGYKTASEMGHVRAMVSMAILYTNGDGVEKSPSRAFQWELRAAEAGHVPSMNVVAVAYQKGEVTQADARAAFHWHLRSAQGGDVKGMVAVAYFYKEGVGTQRNGGEARKWYQASAREGSGWGRQMLANMLDDGNGGPRDPKQAARHLIDALRDCSPVVVDNLTGDYGWFEADTIAEIQTQLTDSGDYSHQIDGSLGVGMTAAIEALCD